jgi:esterase
MRQVDMSVLDRFHIEWTGLAEGPTLVFLHGLLGSASNFRRIAKGFEQTHRCLLFDQRGHGRSHKPLTGYSPGHYAQDLLEILNESRSGQNGDASLSKIDLVGHSMGGRNAVCFATLHPERVRRLVVEDIGPDARPDAIVRIRRLLDKAPTPFPDKATAREFFATQFEDQKLGQYLYTNITEVRGGQYDWRFSKPAMFATLEEGRNADRWDEWRSLKCPTLLVRGDRSEDLSQDVFERCAKENPVVTLSLIEDAGHWVHFDQPEKFIEVLQNFLLDPSKGPS